MNFLTIFKSGKNLDSLKVTEKEFNKVIPKTFETPKSSIPMALQVQYKENFESFDKWEDNHRKHQTNAINACESNVIGQICLPTATGKTRVQIDLHIKEMIKRQKEGNYSCFVIAAHRLSLCQQLLKELIEISVNSGISFDILFLGSDRFDESAVHDKFKHNGLNKYVMDSTSTTQQLEVSHAYDSAIENNRHLICVSTYHSFHKLNLIPRIALCTYDEAHTLTNDDFRENIELVKPKIEKSFFFTATRRIIGENFGMNDKVFFGEILYKESPREMIDKGEIVPPKMHIIQTEEDGDYSNHSMLVRSVILGYLQHKKLVKNNSCSSDLIGAKLLITTTGNKEQSELYNDIEFKKFCLDNNIQVFTYSSEYGYFYNFERKSRNEVMTRMQSLKDEEDAILLHIDILTEGIDLPSITGVMPFRELNEVKLLQTIGRAARLLKEDRIKLYSGNLEIKDYVNYIKPYCWIILPEFYRSLGDVKMMKDIIVKIFNEYEIPVEEFSKIDHYVTEIDEDGCRITDRDRSTRRDKTCELTYLIEDIIIEKFNLKYGVKDIINYFKGKIVRPPIEKIEISVEVVEATIKNNDISVEDSTVKRGRGRPKGSLNKPKLKELTNA